MNEEQNTTGGQSIPNQNVEPQEQPVYQASQMNQQNPYGQAYQNQQNPYGQTYQNQQNPYGQTYQNQQNPYGQTYQNQQNPYGQTYQNQQNPYGQTYPNPAVLYGQKPHGTVKDIFCNILLVLNPIGILLAIILSVDMLNSLKESRMYGSYYGSTQIMTPVYGICMMLSMVLGMAVIVFFILDIVQVHKAGYPITGLILFAIFFRMAYYVWRAHVLGRKMTFPVIYTVTYILVYFGYIIGVIGATVATIANVM